MEVAFQSKLDEDVTDGWTRLVFADWLDEHDDERAEGYRILGTLRLYPDMNWPYRFLTDWDVIKPWSPTKWADRSIIPPGWIDVAAVANMGSRRQAEDNAAKLFAGLPHEVKDHIRRMAYGRATEGVREAARPVLAEEA